MKSRNVDVTPVTPAIEEWRRSGPLMKWLMVKPRRGRAALLSTRLGVSRTAVYRYAHGIDLPGSQRFVLLLSILRVSPKRYMQWWDSYPGAETCQPPASASTRRSS